MRIETSITQLLKTLECHWLFMKTREEWCQQNGQIRCPSLVASSLNNLTSIHERSFFVGVVESNTICKENWEESRPPSWRTDLGSQLWTLKWPVNQLQPLESHMAAPWWESLCGSLGVRREVPAYHWGKTIQIGMRVTCNPRQHS